jgi:hypothetical protein
MDFGTGEGKGRDGGRRRWGWDLGTVGDEVAL